MSKIKLNLKGTKRVKVCRGPIQKVNKMKVYPKRPTHNWSNDSKVNFKYLGNKEGFVRIKMDLWVL